MDLFWCLGATEGPGIFLAGHEGSLLFFASSASALPSPDLNSLTRLERAHCWQFLQPREAQLCKPADNKSREWQTCMGREKLPEWFQRCLRKAPGQLPFTVDLAESLWLFALLTNAKSHQCSSISKATGCAAGAHGSRMERLQVSHFSHDPQYGKLLFPSAQQRWEESDGVWGRLWHLG